MSENDLEQITKKIPQPAYFWSLTINDVKCFKGEHKIKLYYSNNIPSMFTVILGNNNSGKTTLLRCLADLTPMEGIKNEDEHLYTPKGSHRRLKNISNGLIKCSWRNGYLIKESSIVTFPAENVTIGDLELNEGTTCSMGSYLPYEFIGNTDIYGYGTSRRMGNSSLSDNENQDNSETLFNENAILINAEEWLIQTDYASKNGLKSAESRLKKIKNILTNGLLPDAKDFKCTTTETNGRIENFVEVETDYGWVKLRDLGYGYQVTLAWIVDLAKKLFERYPNSDNPLHEPAIVLVDEIDLHLHPDWQRKIIKFLREQFPKTQFIVTTHSPVCVQSADNINLVLLKKQNDHVVIEQPDLKTYKGWTIEEILDELMGLGDKTASDDYLQFMREFDEALDEDNYAKAKQAYNELDKILHPQSSQRKLLRIQMSSLMPE